MKLLLAGSAYGAAFKTLCDQIQAQHTDMSSVAFVGIHTRGIPMAKRLVSEFAARGLVVPLGTLDINLYRDDLSEVAETPVLKETKIEFNVTGKIIYVVDDVLYTGRTVRAAMDALFDMGRPKAVHLVVMAKRNGRELPIDTDLAALDVQTVDGDNIKVKFSEIDGQDEVVLYQM